jgi:hypothetical protein
MLRAYLRDPHLDPLRIETRLPCPKTHAKVGPPFFQLKETGLRITRAPKDAAAPATRPDLPKATPK